MQLSKRLVLAFIFMFAGIVAFAQVTTSSLSGRILDASGEPAVGAAVIAVHGPSGTTYGAVTNADGRYTIQGMRPGGPYEVTVNLLGYEDAKVSDVTLQLGETRNVSPVLKESSLFLSESVVTAAADGAKTGASQAIKAQQIQEMPSITRGIADVARVNPFVRTSGSGALSFAGANNKYNSFQIDGAMNNDVFGLTQSGSNGGQAGTQPVSMETIDQIQINIAPFDVRQSGFTGGSINAITKSGTNDFHGSVYGYGLIPALIGNYTLSNGNPSASKEQLEYQAGATLGGPIIKDKLFFFVSYEFANRLSPNMYGLGSEQSNVDKTVAKQVLDFVKEHSDYKGELPSDLQVYTKSHKATAKIDWNINQNNHASFRWSLVDAKQLNSVSGAKSLNATDYSYDFLSKTNSFVAELQSRIGDNASNELRLSYVRVRDKRNPLGDPFPMLQIGGVGSGTVSLGGERSSVANRLDQDIISLTDNFSLYLGNHTLTFGTHNEFYRFTNLFIQDRNGTYYFDTPEDFMHMEGGVWKPVIKQYRYAHANVDVTGDINWEPTFWFGQFGVYGQDKWSIGDRFDLTYGVRVDLPVFIDKPMENTGFTTYANSKGWDLATNRMPKTLPLISPRLGFRYDIAGDSNYVLRGGVGIFTGRIPFVWFSNNFSNTGVQLTSINLQRSSGAGATLDKLSVILDPTKQDQNEAIIKAESGVGGGTQTLNVVDRNFKLAQTARADLGFDFHVLGLDWTLEGVFSKILNDAAYQNVAYEPTGKTVGQTYPDLSYDTRVMYKQVDGVKPYGNIYKLYNTSKGYAYNLMAQVGRSFPFGLDVNASYTYSRAFSVFNATSSVAQSNFAYNYHHSDPHNPELGNSAFNIPHQVKVSAFYHADYGPNKAFRTTIGAVYIGTSGAAYCVYYNGDLNGDSSNGNDLIFIPTDAQVENMTFKDGTGSNAKYTADVQKANLKQWLANTRYLKDHRGEYYDRFADNMPFEHHIDVHFGQKFGFRVGKQIHSIELTADLINFTNLLNPKWGRSYGLGLNAYANPINYSGVNKDSGKPEFQFLHDGNYQMFSYSDDEFNLSRWKAMIGLRYTF